MTGIEAERFASGPFYVKSGVTSYMVLVHGILAVLAAAFVLDTLLNVSRAKEAWPFWILLVAGLGFLVALDLAIINRAFALKVKIDDHGVMFIFLFHQESGAWSELRPGPGPARGGQWSVALRADRTRERLYDSWIRISATQGKAILSHPQAPKWAVSDKVALSLGIPKG